MFDEADLRLTTDDSKPLRKPSRILDDVAILSAIGRVAVERPGRLGLMTRKNEQKLQRWVY